jgi:hypothetical protein
MTDEYNLWIDNEKIVAINRKNSWKRTEKIVVMPKTAYRYYQDLDTPLIITIYSSNEKGFEEFRKRIIALLLDSVVNIIDGETFWKLFDKYYKLEHVSY